MDLEGEGTWLRISLIFLFSCLAFSVHAQPISKFEGRVVDERSGAPIPFATIRLKTKHGITGVISNGGGDFQFPSYFKFDVDTVTISCIGYKTKSLSIVWFTTEKPNIIPLSEAINALHEVTVKAKRDRMSVDRIVQTAIDRIPLNYPVIPHSYIAYYRDYQIEENKYINLNEGIVEIFDEGVQAKDQLTTRIKLLDYKKNTDFARDTLTEVAYDNSAGNKFIPQAFLSPFGGNELSILRVHDAIRNPKEFSYSFVNKLSEDFVPNHFFKLKGIIYLNQTRLYQITFNSRISVTGYRHFSEGEIFIETETFAIHQLKYTTYEKQKSGNKILYNIKVEYLKNDSSMQLNYISFNNYFKLKNPHDFKATDIEINYYDNSITVTFNNKVEKKSAMNKDNYEVKYDDKILKVKGMEIATTQKQVFVYLQEPLPPRKIEPNFGRHFVVKLANIMDTEGREINVITYTDAHQFRELFVQKKTNPTLPMADSLFIEKSKPLFQNKISKHQDISKYWMNTPLIKN